MDLNYFLKTIILGIISSLISAFIIFLIGKLGGNKLILNNSDKKFKITSLSLFSIALFVTLFFGIFSLFSFYSQWTNLGYLIVITIIFGFLTFLIYEKQCPNCHKLFYGKKLVSKETLKDEKRPYAYREQTVYLYSDGSLKERKFSGKEKIKMETIRTEKEFYECESCGHKWDKIFVRNLDEGNRPKPNVIQTHISPPNPLN